MPGRAEPARSKPGPQPEIVAEYSGDAGGDSILELLNKRLDIRLSQ